MKTNNLSEINENNEQIPDENDFDMELEEQKNQTLLSKLKEQQLKHKEYLQLVELDSKAKQKQSDELNKKKILSHKAYIAKRNASAKVRTKDNNEKITKMLNKVGECMKEIENLESIDKIKSQANKEYKNELAQINKKRKLNQENFNRLTQLNQKNNNLREENLLKRKERENEERLKKALKQKAQKQNEKANYLLEHGYTIKNKNNTNNNIQSKQQNNLFQEEKPLIATNNANIEEYENNDNNDYISHNNSNFITKQKIRPSLPENLTKVAEREFRQILKEDKNNINKLLSFQKKYSFYDITNHIHSAQMNQIKNTKTIPKQIPIIHYNNNNNVVISSSKETNLYSSYLNSCKYNNNEYIQSHLINAKNDMDLFKIINERDEYGRKGIMYLIIHNNIPMIKLTLTSGILLSDCIDICNRNIIHYCTLCDNISNDLFKVICQCIIYENKEDFNGMVKYVDKCLTIENIDNDNECSDINECENKIKMFDNNISNKNVMKQKLKENKTKRKEYIKPLSYSEQLKKNKIQILKLINSFDIDGFLPIHYVCKYNNLSKLETLCYYNSKLDVPTSNGKLPIDLTSSEVIQQYLIKNIKAKKASLPTPLTNNNLIDIEQLKYLSTEQINSYVTGYENNNYLLLSVIQNNFEAFKYLLLNKKSKVDFVNANGNTILHLIIQYELYNFFSFLFNLDCNYSTLSELHDEMIAKIYRGKDIYEPNGTLTYTGQSLLILDKLKNNGHNILYMSIDVLNSLEMFKIILNLYEKQLFFFKETSSSLDTVLNRQYGKNKQTLLIKAVEKHNMQIIKYIIEHINVNNDDIIDIYQGDIYNKNVLHYAVLSKQKNLIKYLIEIDSDRNELRVNKDNKGKTPIDYDTSKQFKYELHHIWDASAKNDIHMMDSLLNELKYYNINQQTRLNKNTPLHIAISNKSEKAILYLIKLGCDVNISNQKKETPLQIIKGNSKEEKCFLKKVEKIIKGEITEFEELENKSNDNNIQENKKGIEKEIIKNKKLKDIVNVIRNEFQNRKINVRNLLEKLDKEGKGIMKGNEFEMLFTVLDFDGVSGKDILYLNSYLDELQRGFFEYEEFIKLIEGDKK